MTQPSDDTSASALRVGIQGVPGCYHDAAAHLYFADRDIMPVAFDTFDAEFDHLANDASMVGAVAIENTIAGALLQNHELLRKSNLVIVGEHKMRISHTLCALPGQRIDQLTEVNSHPMALMQCANYLNLHPNLRKVEKFDTAGSAKEISEQILTGHAAVCGEYAAELYGLEILDRGIETNKRNFTRFLFVCDPLMAHELAPRSEDTDKASIVFTIPHAKGSLCHILTILSFYDINMSKIQSMPIIGREWEYRFYVDVTYDSYVRYRQSIEAVRPLLNDLRILGEYKECKNEI